MMAVSNSIDAGVGRPREDSSIGGIVDKQAEEKDKKLKKACADFESILVYYLFKSMRQTVSAGGLLGNSPGKDTYNMMMDQKVAEDMAHRGEGLGLQKTLFNQLNRNSQKNKEGGALREAQPTDPVLQVRSTYIGD